MRIQVSNAVVITDKCPARVFCEAVLITGSAHIELRVGANYADWAFNLIQNRFCFGPNQYPPLFRCLHV
jgi:hypothetical protein